jgi:glycosyltransferase involved in cell wall biosynthesis
VQEAVVDGETGLLVAPGDPDALAHALRSLLSDPELGRRLGRNGRDLALARFTSSEMAEAFDSAYRSVLTPSR